MNDEFGSHISNPKKEKAYREARRKNKMPKHIDVKPTLVAASKGEQNTYVEIAMNNGSTFRYVLTGCKNEAAYVEKAFIQCLNEKVTADKVEARLKELGLVYATFCTEI